MTINNFSPDENEIRSKNRKNKFTKLLLPRNKRLGNLGYMKRMMINKL